MYERETGKWVLVMTLLILILGSFVVLSVYGTRVKVQTWWMTKEYAGTPPTFSASIELAVGNPSPFPLLVRDMLVEVTINGVDVGTSYLPQEALWVEVLALDWQTWTLTFNVTGSSAEALGLTDVHDVQVTLRGEAFCMIYRTRFAAVHRKAYTPP